MLVQPGFWDPTTYKQTAAAFQNPLTFDQNLFNSRSNIYVNYVYWIQLNPKNAILPFFFFGQTQHVLVETKKWTNNLHHRKAVSNVIFKA